MRLLYCANDGSVSRILGGGRGGDLRQVGRGQQQAQSRLQQDTVLRTAGEARWAGSRLGRHLLHQQGGSGRTPRAHLLDVPLVLERGQMLY
jgi:hypothetical protein